MKNLFFKELKLSMHPLVWIFTLVFPFLCLIPSYPYFVSFIYCLASYSILFLGANKGQQSNDILYTCLLPVRKKDVVKARLLTVIFIQVVSTVLVAALSPISMKIRANIIASGQPFEEVGMGPQQLLSFIGINLFAFGFVDLVFFASFYKNGRSIVRSTLLTVLPYSIFIALVTVILPMSVDSIGDILLRGNIITQLIIFAIGLVVYIGLHIATVKVSTNNLEKVDF